MNAMRTGLRRGTICVLLGVTSLVAGLAAAVSPADAGAVLPALLITASDGDTTYGAIPPFIVPSYSGFVNGDTAASLTTAPTCTANTTASTPAGTYPSMSSCSGAVDPNYRIGYANGQVTVAKALLTAKVVDVTRAFGQQNPSFALSSFSGFVNGDDSSVVTGIPTMVTTATSTSDPGSYPILVGNFLLSAHNYDFSLTPGTLTVTKAPVTVWTSYIHYLPSLESNRLNFEAVVTNAAAGSRAAGVPVTFRMSNALTSLMGVLLGNPNFGVNTCTATTDADGIATCTIPGSNVNWTTVALSNSYTATSAATTDYLAGSTNGGVVAY